MLRKFLSFFIVFGLSFLVQHLGGTDQGTAFIWIDIGWTILIVAIMILICLVAGDGIAEKVEISFRIALVCVVELAICLFATWGATKLFHVDFAITYQIMCFGQCLCVEKKKKKKND